MVLTNSRQLMDGKENSLTKGKIQIQSEGAEVFYREIKLKSLKNSKNLKLNNYKLHFRGLYETGVKE